MKYLVACLLISTAYGCETTQTQLDDTRLQAAMELDDAAVFAELGSREFVKWLTTHEDSPSESELARLEALDIPGTRAGLERTAANIREQIEKEHSAPWENEAARQQTIQYLSNALNATQAAIDNWQIIANIAETYHR